MCQDLRVQALTVLAASAFSLGGNQLPCKKFSCPETSMLWGIINWKYGETMQWRIVEALHMTPVELSKLVLRSLSQPRLDEVYMSYPHHKLGNRLHKKDVKVQPAGFWVRQLTHHILIRTQAVNDTSPLNVAIGFRLTEETEKRKDRGNLRWALVGRGGDRGCDKLPRKSLDIIPSPINKSNLCC